MMVEPHVSLGFQLNLYRFICFFSLNLDFELRVDILTKHKLKSTTCSHFNCSIFFFILTDVKAQNF